MPAAFSPAAGRTPKRKRARASRRVPGLARKQLDCFISLEPKVLRGDDAEAIHDLRVASRRLQQILDLMYPKPRPQKIRKLRRTIRRSRRALSTVRNCDVLLERVEKALHRRGLSHREVWDAFQDYLKDRRATSFRKALRRLSGLNLPGFYLSLKNHLENSTKSPATFSALSRDNHSSPGAASGEPMGTRIEEALQETWSELSGRVEQSREDTSAPVLHAVRIAAKRVRYLIEVIHELGDAGSEQALACLRQLQQHLGDWHDLEVMEETLLGMASRPKFLQRHLELALETGKMVLRNRRRKRLYEAKFFQMVKDSPEWTRLASWVSAFLAASSPASSAPRSHAPV